MLFKNETLKKGTHTFLLCAFLSCAFLCCAFLSCGARQVSHGPYGTAGFRKGQWRLFGRQCPLKDIKGSRCQEHDAAESRSMRSFFPINKIWLSNQINGISAPFCCCPSRSFQNVYLPSPSPGRMAWAISANLREAANDK